jgi:hypothetical protein
MTATIRRDSRAVRHVRARFGAREHERFRGTEGAVSNYRRSMTVSTRTNGAISTGTMANEVSTTRLAAALIAFGAIASAWVLATRTTVEGNGAVSRPFVGHAIAIGTVGFGLVALVLFLAAWAGAWRDLRL